MNWLISIEFHQRALFTPCYRISILWKSSALFLWRTKMSSLLKMNTLNKTHGLHREDSTNLNSGGVLRYITCIPISSSFVLTRNAMMHCTTQLSRLPCKMGVFKQVASRIHAMHTIQSRQHRCMNNIIYSGCSHNITWVWPLKVEVDIFIQTNRCPTISTFTFTFYFSNCKHTGG